MKSRKPSPFSHRIARVTSSEVKQYSGNYVEHIARERSTPITRSRMTSTDYGGRSGSRSFATISLMRRWIYATGDSTALVSPRTPLPRSQTTLVLGSALRAVGTCSSSSPSALTTARDPESVGVKTPREQDIGKSLRDAGGSAFSGDGAAAPSKSDRPGEPCTPAVSTRWISAREQRSAVAIARNKRLARRISVAAERRWRAGAVYFIAAHTRTLPGGFPGPLAGLLALALRHDPGFSRRSGGTSAPYRSETQRATLLTM